MFLDRIRSQQPSAAVADDTASGGAAAVSQIDSGDGLQISNVWSGPIIILTSDQQAELDKHYLSYNSTISSESFDAIFGDSF